MLNYSFVISLHILISHDMLNVHLELQLPLDSKKLVYKHVCLKVVDTDFRVYIFVLKL